MDVSRRRAGARSSVVAGSVWESRIKIDDGKGGIKVFNGEENSEESGTKLKKNLPLGGVSGKRKQWKSESFEGFDKNPIQIAKGKTESPKNLDGQCKELSVSVDGIRKSPIQAAKGKSESRRNLEENIRELSVSADGIRKSPNQRRKLRSEGSKEDEGMFVEGIERSPIGIRKQRSESVKGSGELGKDFCESGEEIEKISVQLGKSKSENVKVVEQSGKNGDGIEMNLLQLRAKSEPDKDLTESGKGNAGIAQGIEKNPVEEIQKTGSEETCKEFGVCQEKTISSTTSNAGQPISAPKVLVVDDDDVDDSDEEYFEDEEEDVGGDEIVVEIEKQKFDVKEINIPEQKPKKVVIEEKKFHQFHQRSARISSTVNKQPPPITKQPKIYTNFTKPTSRPVSDGYQKFPETQNKLQSLVDLVMWRDVSRSAFVFGTGTFLIVSSSYTRDLNISFISVISYLGLVYLAAIFLYRSIICRGFVDLDETSYVVGEEEAIWLLRLALPYLNEFLLKLRALFSGDPATTMKLAVLLFVLARCGSSITIWKMVKLGFFGVFIAPKVCSSYSSHLTAYGKFWVRRFRDAWDSCSQKKAAAIAIFVLVWNLSSMVARIWAAFLMFVAVRYYQQSIGGDEWVDQDDIVGEADSWQRQRQRQGQGQRQGHGPSFVEANKVKKGS